MSRLRRPSLYERCIFAVAAGHAGGGYDTIVEAAAHMAHVQSRTYKPRPEAHEVYDRLFKE